MAKPLLIWFGQSLVEYQVASLLEGGVDSVIVVTGARADRLRPLMDGMELIKVVHNPDYATGKASSVRVGAASLSNECDAVMLLAVDQPRPAWVVKKVLDSHRSTNALITSPKYSGHGGHPLVFSASLIGELKSVSDEHEGVRELMSRHAEEVNNVQFDSSIVRLDLNTPEDYVAALNSYRTLASDQGS